MISRQEQTEPAIQVGFSALNKFDLTLKLLKYAIIRNYLSYLVLVEICTNPTATMIKYPVMCCMQYHYNQVANTKPESGKRMINYYTKAI